MHGDRRAHDDDLDDVVQRALAAGCKKLMITGSDLEESRKAVELARLYREFGLAVIQNPDAQMRRSSS